MNCLGMQHIWPDFYVKTDMNTLRPRQNGRHFTDDIFKCFLLNENVWIMIKISLKFVPKGPINNIPVLVQIMAWRRPGDKPLSEPITVSLPTYICVARPQWVKPNQSINQLINQSTIFLPLSSRLKTKNLWTISWNSTSPMSKQRWLNILEVMEQRNTGFISLHLAMGKKLVFRHQVRMGHSVPEMNKVPSNRW